MSESLLDPQIEPPEQVLLVVADYGSEQGGWGPAAVSTPFGWGPFVYTAESARVLQAAHDLAKTIAEQQGIEARVVKFTSREDLGVYAPEPSNES